MQSWRGRNDIKCEIFWGDEKASKYSGVGQDEASEFLSPLWVSGLDIWPICLTSDTEKFPLFVSLSLPPSISLRLSLYILMGN